MNDIVVGIDRSETAARAAVVAAETAQALGTNLHLVMCAERSKSLNMSAGGDRFHSDWLSEAEQFLRDVAKRLPCDRVTQSVSSGDPAEELCEEARRLDARMIVIGNRRVHGMARVLGSVAGDVLKKADCDVLVVNTAS
jgi:nucleotide-binding universal stress UspA family protein